VAADNTRFSESAPCPKALPFTGPYEHHSIFRLRFEHEHTASPLSRARLPVHICRSVTELQAVLPQAQQRRFCEMQCFQDRGADGCRDWGSLRNSIKPEARADDSLQPYSWYKNFVLAGAEEHRLPAEYVESRIGAVHAIRDPDPQRAQARRAGGRAAASSFTTSSVPASRSRKADGIMSRKTLPS
jgi:hypothetical protein